MTIYCDNLTLGAFIVIIRLTWNMRYSPKKCNILILDPLRRSIFSTILFSIIRNTGFSIREAEFYTGHLNTPDGQIVYLKARDISKALSLNAAKGVLANSKHLYRLNQEWGRNTLLKYIAGSIYPLAQQTALLLLTAEALSFKINNNEVFLVISKRISFDFDMLRKLTQNVKVFYYPKWSFDLFKRNRLSVLMLLLYIKLKEIKWIVLSPIERESSTRKHLKSIDKQQPSLLLLQEDDISLDRSYRTQPHWFFAKNGKMPFETFILEINSVERLPVDKNALREQGISLISQKELYLLSRRFASSNSVGKRIRKDIQNSTFVSIFGSPKEVSILFRIVQLLYSAKIMAGFCGGFQIRAFMTCENYFLYSDAMLLIAPLLNIKTVSFQYSNRLNIAVPQMLTTSDIMLTFSPLYHSRLKTDDIKPGKFIDIGYIYDTSFKCVQRRALELKQSLHKAGAKFIICYFDESVQSGKYGLVSIESHCAEIEALLNLVCSDPAVGVVIKTQFQRNSPQHLGSISKVHTLAKATGRYVELYHGANRNIIFPAEAALSADISIGYTMGATASLEAALAGSRSILLNPYGFKSDNDTLYAQVDIVYKTMSDALKAVEGFRKSERKYAGLGDWTPILDSFDPFRDGCSGNRLSELLLQVCQ